jgi:hypothetical protein
LGVHTHDPVAGLFPEKLAEAAAVGGIIFEYGARSMQPTPFPQFTVLIKEADQDLPIAPPVPSEGRQDISVCTDRAGLQISRVELAGGKNCDYCSLVRGRTP